MENNIYGKISVFENIDFYNWNVRWSNPDYPMVWVRTLNESYA